MASSSTDLPPAVNKGPAILIACGICVAVALVMVVIRIVVRVKVLRNIGPDDHCIVAAMIVMFAEMMIIIPQVILGAGRHHHYIPDEDFVAGLHLNFVTQPLCLIALCLTKINVGLFLLRLTTTKWHIRLVWGIVILPILSWAGSFLTVFFQCQPLRLIWDSTTPGRCIPPSQLKFAAFFNSSVSALTDLLFALLPIPLMYGVQMNKRTKIAIATILSLGILCVMFALPSEHSRTCIDNRDSATVAAIIKMLHLGSYGQYGDFLYDSAEITIWTTVEICTAIVAACAPCLKPLVRTVLNTTSHNRSRRGYVHYSENFPSGPVAAASHSWGHLNARKSDPVHLSSLSQVYSSARHGNDLRNESQEMFGREAMVQDEVEQRAGIAKTVSISVR